MYTIYKLEFPDGRVYIGQTERSLKERFDNGMGYLYSNGKCSRSLVAKAIVWFGWNNVKHTILETTDNLQKAQMLEQEYIKKFKSYETEFGFNTQSGGKKGYSYNSDFITTVKGVRKSINTEFKLGHACFTAHPFICLNNGKTYMTRKDAEKDLGVKLNHIYEVCQGHRTNCKGFKFIYCEDNK